MKPNVLIYSDTLLPPTQTFVRAQGEALEAFVPYYVGTRRLRAGSLEMPTDRTMAINGLPGVLGKLREIPFRRFGFAPVYFRRLRRLKPVLLHAHGGPAGLSTLPIAKYLGIPQVTTFHGFDATAKNPYVTDPRYGNWDYVRRKHVLMAKGRLFIAVSQFIRDRILQQGFPEQKVVVHYTGVDTEFFKPDQKVGRESIVLFVGSLHEGKGCEFAIRAMAKVQFTFPAAELIIIGNGPLRSDLERMAKDGLRRYRFLGMQPPTVVRQWMNRARIFMTPSVTANSGWTEGFGMVFGEAQAMCLPVVSFRSGGIPEVVAHDETGFLVPERDAKGLAHYLQTLLTDQKLCVQMGEAARKRVRALFNLKDQTGKLEELYTWTLRGCTTP